MKLALELKDDQYPFTKITRTRHNCRGVVFNHEGKIALTHLLADDAFGHRDYYELPGGGQKLHESLTEAVIREMEEELGVKAFVTRELGVVHDYYNLIEQENFNYYFILSVNGQTQAHLEPREARLIDKFVWVSLDDAITLFTSQTEFGVGVLVKRRELPVLHLVKEIKEREVRNEE